MKVILVVLAHPESNEPYYCHALGEAYCFVAGEARHTIRKINLR